MLTAAAITARAIALGFDRCGVAPAVELPELRYLREWIDRGYAGEMGYLARTADRRADVRAVMPSARSVIVLATVYNVDRAYSTELTDRRTGHIARYAWGDDYHDVVGRRTDELLCWMRAQTQEAFEAKAYVDTGPIQERVYAQYAGLGWIGKNTCLINPELGSWLFLSEIIVSLALEPDQPGFDRCGTCTLCLDACPTGAIPEPWVLDATRCLSYLTIELKGNIPEAQRPALGTHLFGCDVCQEVCPWNAAPARSTAATWQPRVALDRPRVVDLWRRSDDDLRATIKGSALRRAGVTRLRRNLAVAIANSWDPDAHDALTTSSDQLRESPSRADPLVAEHVDWATRQLREGQSNGR